MISKAKDFIFANIHRLPVRLNYYLSKLNNKAERIYGKEYAKYIQSLKKDELPENTYPSKLITILNYSIKNVAYYQNLYAGIIIKDIEDFKNHFGFTDKNIVLENLESFKSENINIDNYDMVTTGGTSGKPLQLLIPKTRYVSEWATIHDSWSRVGFNFHLRAVLRNHKLSGGKDYTINPVTKEIMFDNFRLNEEYMFKIYSVLIKFKIQYIHAYPSVAYQFSAFCVANSLDLTFLKAFLSSSENIYPHQLNFIKGKAETRLFGFYGHTEKLLFGAFCEKSDHFHMESSYGFFELIDKKGNEVNTPGAIGEMVGTTLNNLGMPLIRYKTGDYAEYLADHCNECGRKMPILKKIMGRWDGDKIYNKDGSYITTTALNLHSDLYTVINGLQYYQKDKGQLEISLIKGDGYSRVYELMLKDNISEKFANDTVITIKYVEELKYNKNGKFILLHSEVK